MLALTLALGLFATLVVLQTAGLFFFTRSAGGRVDAREEELAKAKGASKPSVLSGGGGEVITRGSSDSSGWPSGGSIRKI